MVYCCVVLCCPSIMRVGLVDVWSKLMYACLVDNFQPN